MPRRALTDDQAAEPARLLATGETCGPADPILAVALHQSIEAARIAPVRMAR